ncbi:hypothetical protein CSE899_18749 [Cronobacter sakazakii E899]|nr:hypothetical protein CSE899_18749 [Cronobacter sakazakii E899]
MPIIVTRHILPKTLLACFSPFVDKQNLSIIGRPTRRVEIPAAAFLDEDTFFLRFFGLFLLILRMK